MRSRERYAGLTEGITKAGKIHLSIPVLTEDEFMASPVSLSLADMFIEDECALTYEEYRACMDELESLAESHDGFILSQSASTFKNINIIIFTCL